MIDQFLLKHTMLMLFSAAVLLLGAPLVMADSNNLIETPFPQTIQPALLHLYEVADISRELQPEITRLGPLLDFVLTMPPPQVLYQADDLIGLPSAYYAFDMQTTLENIIKLAFNPDIPSSMTAPASVRLSSWRQVNGEEAPFPTLWPRLADLDRPVVITAVEYEEITPDLFSGAYYAYELDRTIMLFTYNQHTVLLALSRQRDSSEVGRQGVVLDDQIWQYLYFEDRGLSRAGLGWVNSYIYDSFGVSIYMAANHAEPPLRVGMFKGLRAGWAGINMVKNFHIRRGQERHAAALTEVLENSTLPDIETISAVVQTIADLAPATLQEYVHACHHNLNADSFEELTSTSRRLLEQARQPDYAQSLTRPQQKAVLHLEYLKSILGKPNCPDIKSLVGPSQALVERTETQQLANTANQDAKL